MQVCRLVSASISLMMLAYILVTGETPAPNINQIIEKLSDHHLQRGLVFFRKQLLELE